MINIILLKRRLKLRLLNNFKTRLAADRGLLESEPYLDAVLTTTDSVKLLGKASLILTPSGYKENKLYSVLPGNGNGDMTFVRATTATRVNSLGFIEDTPYNLLKHSEDFIGTGWFNSNYTVTTNTIVAPDGTLTADLISRSSTISPCTFQQNYSLGNGDKYTITIYAKLGTVSTNFGLRIQGVYPDRGDALFNLSTGTLIGAINGGTNTNTSAIITPAGDGWYKLTLKTQFANNISIAGILFGATNITNISGWEAPNTVLSNAYVWGAQLVQGSIAKDYFPTTNRLNVPRLNYSDGTASLLLEPQRTNLLSYSSTFTDNAWIKVSTTPVLDSTILSPDGTRNSYKISRASTSASSYISKSSTSSTGTVYNFTVYAKLGDVSTNIGLRIQAAYPNRGDALFNLSTGTLIVVANGGTNTSTSGTIQSVGNGWYRCSVTTTFAGTGVNIQGIVSPSANTTATGFEGPDGALSNAYVWGAQLEIGAYATSYIPTTTSTVTRNQDLASVSNASSLIGQTEGVLFVESAALANDLTQRVVSISDGTTSNRIGIYYNSNSNQILCFGAANGTNFASAIAHTITDETQFAKIAVRYKLNDFTLWINGSKRGTDLTSQALPLNLSRFAFDSGSGTSNLFAKVKQTQLYKTYLTDAEMTSLTTL